MIDERDVDGFSELRAALRVEPSADFSARVRASVAGRSIRAWVGWDWRVMLAGAAIAAALIGGAAWLAGSTPHSAAQSSTVATRSPERDQPAAIAVAPIVVPVGRRAPGSTRGRRAAAATGAPKDPKEVAEPAPEVLVPPDQAIAVRRLLQVLRDRRLSLAAAGRQRVDEVTGDLLPLSLLEIPLITIELLPEPIGNDRERNPS
jgi:hypothetical protein